jgi:hypothetical protein
MIEVGNWVLVKVKDDFPSAIVLEIAKNDAGKRIYRVAHSLSTRQPELNYGYWVDGNKVFEMDEQPKSEKVEDGSTPNEQSTLRVVQWFGEMMTIELNFADLTLLAVHSEVVKDGVTIKINRPILPSLNTLMKSQGKDSKDEFVAFTIDGSDPRSEQWAFKPEKAKK